MTYKQYCEEVFKTAKPIPEYYLNELQALIDSKGAIATAELIEISPTRLRKVLRLKEAPSGTMNKITNTIDLIQAA